MNSITIKKLLKMTNELYEKEAQDFSDTHKEVWEKEILDFVDKIKSGSSVLDLGCGNGRLFQKLMDIYCNKEKENKITDNYFTKSCDRKKMQSKLEYFGIDTSKKFIKLNKKKYFTSNNQRISATFKVGDGLKLKYKNKFDYVISIAVLHHIPSEQLQLKFMKNIYQILKPKGKTLISVWNRNQDQYKKYLTKQYKQELINKFPRQSALISALIREIGEADLLVPWKNSGQFRYIHVFTPTELKTLAQKAGLKNIKVTASKHGHRTSIDKALGIYLIAEK